MPTYDYQCRSCNHEFSARHKISDAPPDCPLCGGAVNKKVTAPAVLGGSGGGKATPELSGGGCGSGCGCHRPQ